MLHRLQDPQQPDPEAAPQGGGAESEAPFGSGGTFLDQEFFRVGNQTVTYTDLLAVAVVLSATWLFSGMAQRGLQRVYQRRKIRDEGTLRVSQRLLHYGIMALGTVAALKIGGIDLTALFAAGAVFAVVLGIAMQNVSENFIAGVILMAERSITPGDVLEVEGRVVRVMRMGIRATVARTRDEEELIIPNSLLVRTTVKNYTLRDSLYRLRAKVGVAHGSDLKLVREVLQATAAKLPWRDVERDPRVLLLEIGSSAIHYDVSVWIEDPWHSQRALSQFNEAIWQAFRDNGITVAFPQLELHLDAEGLQRMRSEPGGG